MGAGFVQHFVVAFECAIFQNRHIGEQFFLKIEQKQTHAGAIDWVARHQLRVREALIDVFVDDVGLIQNQIALNQNRHLTIGIHHIDVFRLVVQVHITNLKIHAFFKQHETAAMRKRASRSRIQHHHDRSSFKSKGVTGLPITPYLQKINGCFRRFFACYFRPKESCEA